MMHSWVLLLTCVLGTTLSVYGSVCESGSDILIPHEGRCSLYYNCSAPKQNYYWEEHLQECTHPQVYNTNTQRCEHYSMVDCGERDMPYGPCDYKTSECIRAHCRPCSVDNPSCKYLENGLHAYPNRPQSSYFIVCVDKRLVHTDTCRQFQEETQIFDPEKKTCVSV